MAEATSRRRAETVRAGRGPGPARAPDRVGQARAGRVRARPRELGVEIVSTGGTARELAEAGIETRPVEEYTGFPEILDGRVKTLNPRIYAGLLAVRSDDEHVATLDEHAIEPIDLVCVNLYPFERVVAPARRGGRTR